MGDPVDISRRQCEDILTALENGGYTVSPDARFILIAIFRLHLGLERKVERLSLDFNIKKYRG